MAVAALTAIIPQPAQAVQITAYELISDLTTHNDEVDLNRERHNGVASTWETVDSSIRTQNHMNGSEFGKYNDDTVNYTHVLTWLAHGTFTSATLTIGAWNVSGQNDYVYLVIPGPNNDFSLGTLEHNPSNAGDTFTPFIVNLSYLSTDALALSIDKSNNDKIEIFSSKLSVTWDDGQTSGGGDNSLPDAGASLALLGMGLISLGMLKRKLT